MNGACSKFLNISARDGLSSKLDDPGHDSGERKEDRGCQKGSGTKIDARRKKMKNRTGEGEKERLETARKTSRCAYLLADGDVIRPSQGTLNITARYADSEEPSPVPLRSGSLVAIFASVELSRPRERPPPHRSIQSTKWHLLMTSGIYRRKANKMCEDWRYARNVQSLQ